MLLHANYWISTVFDVWSLRKYLIYVDSDLTLFNIHAAARRCEFTQNERAAVINVLWRWSEYHLNHRRRAIYKQHAHHNCPARRAVRKSWNVQSSFRTEIDFVELRSQNECTWSRFSLQFCRFYLWKFSRSHCALCNELVQWISIVYVCILCKHWSIVESHAIRKYELLIRQEASNEPWCECDASCRRRNDWIYYVSNQTTV